ncbi:retrotransposon ORF1 [Tanacetum coccineum]
MPTISILVRLDGKIKPEEERAMVKVKGKMLKEKKDLGAFIFPIRLEGLINENALADTGSDTNTMPYRIYEQLGRDDIMQEERNITMINYTEAKVTGRLVNVLCQVGFTILSAQFLILEIPIDRDEPIMVGHGFLDTIRGNIDIPNRILITFDGLTRQTFRAARSEKIKIAESDSDDEEDYEHMIMRSGDPVPNALEMLKPLKKHYSQMFTMNSWNGVVVVEKQNWQLLHKISYGEEIDTMLKISLKEAEFDEEIFFYVAYVRAFNIREPIYLELCREFYATYEFDERLGLYHADELEKEGFDTYFQGGLRSDENFNAREYYERISIDRDLHLSRSSITFVRFPILRVLHKMITYRLCQMATGYEKIQRNDLWLLSMFEARHQNGYANVAWVIAKWIKRKGAGSQKDSQIYCSQFISKIARKSRVLTKEIVHTLSTSVYCKDLDKTTRRELIDFEDRLIHDILVDDVPRVAAQRAPRVQRALMQDLYERMGSMEIRQEAIERLEYR